MTSLSPRIGFVTFAFAAFALGASAQTQDPRDRADASKSGSASTTQRTTTRTTARGPLPDPVLLDGSTQAAEKRPEQGMLGEFELPGDDNVRNGKVGGQQQPQQQGASGGQQSPMGLPQAGGGGGGQQSQQQAAAGGGGQQSSAQSGAQAAGGAQAQSSEKGGAGGGGPADPNAKAEGTQVGQLSGEGGGADGAAGADGLGPKPSPVAIGDSAMRIKGVANAPSVVGATQSAGNTQQMEKSIGGKGGGGSRDGRNASEKGRTMPAGL